MTIKDIAKQCSVSVSTVSRVLNGKPDVSDDVRRKVQAVIDACNYIPNDSARVLVRTKSEAIGLVVRGVSNPFYTDIIHAIEKTVTDAGFSLVMQQIPSCGDEVQRAAVMEREKRLQGIIFLGGRFDYTPEDLTMLNVPFVCCSYSNQYGTLRVGEYSAVSIADEETARQAVDHLYDHGHRRIAALICRRARSLRRCSPLPTPWPSALCARCGTPDAASRRTAPSSPSTDWSCPPTSSRR